MEVFIHSNRGFESKKVTVQPHQKIGLLIKEHFPVLAHQGDFLEDVEIYLLNKKDDLDKGLSFQDAGICGGDHLFIGR